MKIAITALGNNLDAQIDPRFGRCQFIIFFDTATDKFEAVNNQNVMASGGAGIKTAQTMIDNNVDAVISGNYGPNSFRTLSAGNIKIFGNASGTVKTVIDAYKNNQLTEIDRENTSDHAGIK